MRCTDHETHDAGCAVCRILRRRSQRDGGGVPPVVKLATKNAPVPRLADSPCPHRGAATGELSPCAEGCGRGAKLKLFACALHGKCSIAKATEAGSPVCSRCPDRPR